MFDSWWRSFVCCFVIFCSGAGGYDALFCIVLEEWAQQVVDLWEGWRDLQVCPLPIEFDHRGVIIEA
jgi:phosphomevalonate kinase